MATNQVSGSSKRQLNLNQSAPKALSLLGPFLLLRQELLRLGHLGRQILFDDEVEAVLGESLLLSTNAHLDHLPERFGPRFVLNKEGVIFEGVFGPLDVDIVELMGRIFEFIVDDVLGSQAQIMSLGHAEEAIDMGSVAGADLERAVDIGHPVGVAIGEGINGDALFVGETSDKSPGRTGGDPAHGD